MKKLAVALLLALAVSASDACMTFVVGKKLSATGRVIVGHNEDDWPPFETHHGMLMARDWPEGTFLPATAGCNPRIPQAAHTYACYWGEVKFPYGDGNADTFLNENGVLVLSNSGGNSTERMDDPSLLTKGGVKFNLRRSVGERAKSARDGVRILCELVEKYGYAPSARIYTVADRDEAWLVQVVHGRHYVAVRCPDDEVTVMPNLYTVYGLDAWPAEDVLASPGLLENAKRKGFWDGVSKFNFAKAYQGSYDYGDDHAFEHPNNTGRFRQALRLLTGAEWPEDRPFPFSVKPSKPVFGVEDLRALLTAHNGPLADGQHVLETWSICSSTTIESEICVFAEDPRDNEMQVALGRGCEKPYYKFRPFREGLPDEIDESVSAVKRLATHVRAMPPEEQWGKRTEVLDIPYLERDEAAAADEYRRKMCKLDIAYPNGVTNYATVVWFHGGGLTRGNKYFPRLDARRIGVITANYRLMGENGITNAAPALTDAAAAVAWAIRHIAEFGGDPKKVFVSGMSGGGYLSMMVGMDPQWLAKHGLKLSDLAGIAPDSGQATTHFAVKKFRGDQRQGTMPVIDEWAPLWHCSRDVPPIVCITGQPGYEWPGRAEENELLIGTLKSLGHKKAWYVRLPYATHGWAAACGEPYIELFALGKYPEEK